MITQALVPGESHFLTLSVFSYIKHRAFPKSTASTVTQTRTSCQEWSVGKNPFGAMPSAYNPSNKHYVLPTLFLEYFKLFWFFFWNVQLVEKLRTIEMPKRRMNPRHLSDRLFITSRREGNLAETPDISLKVELLMRKKCLDQWCAPAWR